MCGCLSRAPLLGTWPGTQTRAGNRTGNSLVHRPVLNPLSPISQGWCTSNFIFSPYFILPSPNIRHNFKTGLITHICSVTDFF